jgi:hypothetical protein
MKPGLLVWEWANRRRKGTVRQLLILLRPKSMLVNKKIGVSPVTVIPVDEGTDSL